MARFLVDSPTYSEYDAVLEAERAEVTPEGVLMFLDSRGELLAAFREWSQFTIVPPIPQVSADSITIGYAKETGTPA